MVKFSKGDTKDEGDEKPQEKEENDNDKDEDKVIFVHYEQRKVMVAQLHSFEDSDSASQPPSELRQVTQDAMTFRQLTTVKKKTLNEVPSALSISASTPGVPHSGPQPTPLLP